MSYAVISLKQINNEFIPNYHINFHLICSYTFCIVFILYLEKKHLSDCQKQFEEAMRNLLQTGVCGDGKTVLKVRKFSLPYLNKRLEK